MWPFSRRKCRALTTPRNAEEQEARFKELISMIEVNHQHWDQGSWHCMTAHCAAGLCDIIIEGRKPSTWAYWWFNARDADHVSRLTIRAMSWLGLESTREFVLDGVTIPCHHLFDYNNTILDLKRIAAGVVHETRIREKQERCQTATSSSSPVTSPETLNCGSLLAEQPSLS